MDLYTEYQQYKFLYDNLIKLRAYKEDNMIDFMRWDLYPKQHTFRGKVLDRIKSKRGKKIYVIFGGNRSGKTETGAGIVAEAAEMFPGLRIGCATVESKLSIQVQQRKISKLLRKSNIQYGDYNPARGYKNNIVTLKNESKLLFRTFEQGRESIQGDDLDLWWIDEECPWDFFQEALARTTDRNGVVLFTFTSLMGFTKLVNYLWEGDQAKIETTIMSLLDNPFVDQQGKEDYLATVDPDEIESRVKGRPHLKEGLVYKEFKEHHKIAPFDYITLAKANPERYFLSEGIDPHTRTPHHWLRFLYDKKYDTLFVVDEYKADKESMLIDEFCSVIKQKRAGILPEYCLIDTSAESPIPIQKHPDEEQENVITLRTEFFRNGINTVLVSKDNAIGINLVKARLGRNKIEGKDRPRLLVFNTCGGVFWEFNRYCWDSYDSSKITEKKELLNRVMKKNDHFMDIIKYECIRRGIHKGELDVVPGTQEVLYDEIGY